MNRSNALNLNIESKTSNLERVLRQFANRSFHSTFNRLVKIELQTIDTLEAILAPEDESPLSILKFSETPAPEPLSQFLIHAKLSALLHQTAQEKVGRI